MSDNVTPFPRQRQQDEEIARLKKQAEDLHPSRTANGERTPHMDGMEPVNYRLEQSEKRAAAADARMERIEDKLTAIQLTLAGLATKDTVRGWGMAVVAIVIASAFSAAAVMLQSSRNELSAFRAGLAALQAASFASHPPVK